MLDFSNEELLRLYHLKDVIRYNCRRKLKDESVAEHSFYVALFSMIICNHYRFDKTTTNAILSKALLHDMPEIDLNDITHNVKERLQLEPLLKTYEDEYYKKNFPTYAKLMADDEENLVNLIVKYADTLSVKQFCLNEQELGNNSNDIQEILASTETRLETIKEKLSHLRF